jgi:hypothetical protein
MKKLFAKIPLNKVEDNINWFVIDPYIAMGVEEGYFLLFYTDLEENSKWDLFFFDVQDAMDYGKQYDIKIEDWKPYDK